MRLLHTMLRVGDLQRSIDFYTRVLGMRVLRQSENTEYKYTLAFVGYTEESEGAVIELTYNWGVDKYDLGNAYGHIALGVDNVAETCERIRSDIESLSSRHKDAVSSLQQKVCPVSLDTQYLAEARHWYM